MPTIEALMAHGLPKPVAQAILCHWRNEQQFPQSPYNWDLLAALIGRALKDAS